MLFEFNIFINYSLNVDFTNATKFIIKKGEDITDEETKKRSFRKSSFSSLAGRSKELCPYQQIDPKSEWLGGWREAIENRNMYKT